MAIENMVEANVNTVNRTANLYEFCLVCNNMFMKKTQRIKIHTQTQNNTHKQKTYLIKSKRER